MSVSCCAFWCALLTKTHVESERVASGPFDMDGKEGLVIHIAGFLGRVDQNAFFVLNRRILTMMRTTNGPWNAFSLQMRLMISDRNGNLLESCDDPMNFGMRPCGLQRNEFYHYSRWSVLNIDRYPHVDVRAKLGSGILQRYTYYESTRRVTGVTFRTSCPSWMWLVGYVNDTTVAGRVEFGQVTLRRIFLTGEKLDGSDYLCDLKQVVRVLLFKAQVLESGEEKQSVVVPVQQEWRLFNHSGRLYIECSTLPWNGGYRNAFSQRTWHLTQQLPGQYTMRSDCDMDIAVRPRDLVIQGGQCPFGGSAVFRYVGGSVHIDVLHIAAPFSDGTILFGHVDQILIVGLTRRQFSPKVCGTVSGGRVRLLASFDNGSIMDMFADAIAVFRLLPGTFEPGEADYGRDNIPLSRGEFDRPSLRIRLHVMKRL